MGPRWKGKGAEAKALAEPMSEIVSQLQSSLTRSDSQGLLSGCSVLLEAGAEQTELLNRSCFGRPVITAEKDKQWFQLSMEEAFYLCHSLGCLKIVGEDNHLKNDEELWQYMKSRRETFPDFYMAYSHLRIKNWVVRSGSQYGNANGRLRVWSDFDCTIRLCGSVAKTLLVIHINKNGHGATTPLCLKKYSVEERTITRWSAEQCREVQTPETSSNYHLNPSNHEIIFGLLTS
ncbi:unnamed protein product, partial [Vitis vinifera]